MKPLLRSAALLIPLLAAAGFASACPNCKEAIPTTDAQQSSSIAGAMNFSIYYMFAGLFLCLGMMIRTLYKGATSVPMQVPVSPRRPDPRDPQ